MSSSQLAVRLLEVLPRLSNSLWAIHHEIGQGLGGCCPRLSHLLKEFKLHFSSGKVHLCNTTPSAAASSMETEAPCPWTDSMKYAELPISPAFHKRGDQWCEHLIMDFDARPFPQQCNKSRVEALRGVQAVFKGCGMVPTFDVPLVRLRQMQQAAVHHFLTSVRICLKQVSWSADFRLVERREACRYSLEQTSGLWVV
jgi:hypothetical protein